MFKGIVSAVKHCVEAPVEFVKNKALAIVGGTAAVLAGAMGVVEPASAVSLIDTAGAAAIAAGFTDLLDTVKNVLSISWPFMLGGMALMAAPGLVAKMFHKATGK